MALAHRESTHRTYDRAWELFLQFACQHEVALSRLTELHIVDFIALLSWTGLAGSTIETYVSGMRHHLRLRHYDDFAKSFMVSLVLRGAKVANQQPDIRVPITIPMIDTMFQKMHLILASWYKRYLFRCMFLVAFHALLRPGEITDSPHNLRIENVYFRTDGAMVLFLPSAKNNHSSVPQMVEVLPTTAFCPVAEVKQFLQFRKQGPGPLFIHQDGTPVSYAQFHDVVAKLSTFLEAAPETIKPHGFRIGGASHLWLQGFPVEAIRAKGRWSSDVFKKYIRV